MPQESSHVHFSDKIVNWLLYYILCSYKKVQLRMMQTLIVNCKSMLHHWGEHDPELNFGIYLPNGNISGDSKLTIWFFRNSNSLVAVSFK